MTTSLWENTNPRANLFIPATEITEEELEQKGLNYVYVEEGSLTFLEEYHTTRCAGYVVKKKAARRLGDRVLRYAGTPVTVVADGVVGAAVVTAGAGAAAYVLTGGQAAVVAAECLTQ